MYVREMVTSILAWFTQRKEIFSSFDWAVPISECPFISSTLPRNWYCYLTLVFLIIYIYAVGFSFSFFSFFFFFNLMQLLYWTSLTSHAVKIEHKSETETHHWKQEKVRWELGTLQLRKFVSMKESNMHGTTTHTFFLTTQ